LKEAQKCQKHLGNFFIPKCRPSDSNLITLLACCAVHGLSCPETASLLPFDNADAEKMWKVSLFLKLQNYFPFFQNSLAYLQKIGVWEGKCTLAFSLCSLEILVRF